MTREAQLRYCKICNHKKKDLNLGLICSLNGRLADFEEECDSFSPEPQLTEKMPGMVHSIPLEGKLASQGKRLANYLIDQVFLIGIALLLGVVLGILLLYLFPDHLYLLDEDHKLIEYLTGFLIGTIYYSFFEGFTGRSLGKFFTKTKVVNEDGGRPQFKSILIRSLCRHIPFDHFSFLGSDTIGWHDKFSGTRVVEIE